MTVAPVCPDCQHPTTSVRHAQHAVPPTPRVPDARRRGPAPTPDLGALALGTNPQQTFRVLGMVKAGHTIPHIIEVGAYHQAWTAQDVQRILSANRLHPPGFALDEVAPLPGTPVPLPSNTHVEVLRLMCKAMSNAEIATATGLAESTVKNYVRVILRHLDARDRLTAVVLVLTGEVHPVIEAEDT